MASGLEFEAYSQGFHSPLWPKSLNTSKRALLKAACTEKLAGLVFWRAEQQSPKLPSFFPHTQGWTALPRNHGSQVPVFLPIPPTHCISGESSHLGNTLHLLKFSIPTHHLKNPGVWAPKIVPVPTKNAHAFSYACIEDL